LLAIRFVPSSARPDARVIKGIEDKPYRPSRRPPNSGENVAA
jgi:hypothetical protein